MRAVLVFAAALGFYSAAKAQMMMLPGQFDVSPTGAALYTVPIETPPGTAGMSPALTLDYNSAAGNGLLGVGWSLGGLPSIGRCPQTRAQDARTDGVSFDNNDRFCLDGQRLVVVSGTYGAANSEYRTEVEGFTKVVAYGSAGNGPAYFRAWTKSGQVMDFGATANSRILAQGTSTARSWAVNKISDTVGNYLAVTYNNDAANGQVYPTRIDYTGNAGEGLSPYNSVRFEYEARPDDIEQYVAGSVVRTTVRLKKVKTYEGANLVKSYELTYDAGSSTNRSRIIEMTLCDGAGACLPSTTFSLTDATFGFPNQPSSRIPKGDLDNIILYTADFNGNGVTDVMTYNPLTGANEWFFNDGSLSFTKYSSLIPASDITSTSTIVLSRLLLGDWNGDGVTDVMWYDPATNINRWFANDGVASFTRIMKAIHPSLFFTTGDGVYNYAGYSGGLQLGDWNGDGVTDAMVLGENGENRWFINDGNLNFTRLDDRIPPSEIPPALVVPNFYVPPELHFGDWNGDGVTDVMWRGINGANKWFINNGDVSFVKVDEPIVGFLLSFAKLYYDDFNGDGITDLLVVKLPAAFGGVANTWYINDGALNFAIVSNPIPNTIVDDSIVYIGDWNADGINDVMFHNTSSGANHWFVNDGNLNFDYYSNPIPTWKIDGPGALTFGDWNGDGFSEPMWRNPSDGTNLWFYDTDSPPDMLSSVTTGLGSTTDISYKPLTDGSVYAKGSTAVYPSIDIQAPFYVVSRVDADDGVGGNYSSEYAYAGARLHLHGRGFLGFGEQTITDLQTDVEQKLTFLQDHPFIGFVEKDEKSRLGQLLNRRTNTYAATNPGGGPRFPYLEKVVEESNDLNGAAFPTVTTDYAYDDYGNPTQIVVSNSVDSSTQTTVNTYVNDITNWFLGRLENATVTSFVSDAPPPGGGGPGDPGPGPGVPSKIIVVPLNGFTVIPIP